MRRDDLELNDAGNGRLIILLSASLLIFIAWAGFFDIDQSVHTTGQVILSARTQIIQTADGGVLRELPVQEGQSVKSGQILAVLEKDRAQAGFAESQARIMSLKIAMIRAKAEVANTRPLFGREFNEALVHQLVVAYMANARVATRSQKTRGTVKHTTRKPYAQKGTGNARSGMTSSPIWRGGGRTFPNSPDENFSHKMNRKAYRVGMRSILSELVRQERLSIVEEFKVETPKTKQLVNKIKDMGYTQGVLVLTDAFDENLYLSSRNLTNVMVVEAQYADPVSLVQFPNVVATAGALKKLEEMLA